MINRELLMLAHNFNPIKHGIGGWYVSEKLDGMRAYWDGGITRGIECKHVPFANTAKDARLLIDPIATGLWSRYAKPIHAPDWFLDQLPEIPLDGELYLGPGEFQEVMSVVKQHNPDDRWHNVQYAVFDSPPDMHMFMPGKINNPNCKLILPDLREKYQRIGANALPFYKMLSKLDKWVDGPNVYVLQQTKIDNRTPQALKFLETYLNIVTDGGGEGLILRKPESVWFPKRSNELLKIKKLLDSEATVVGYTWGKGKLEGLMGAAIVKWNNGKTFELSGFTNLEREMVNNKGQEPGAIVQGTWNTKFPIGSTITFRYTEVSKDGIPLKARYYRLPEVQKSF